MATQTHRDAVGDGFDHSPQRIPVAGRLLDLVDHGLGGVVVEASHLVGVHGIEITRTGTTATDPPK